ncbi:fatty acid--CoA ligase [uncultured Castellaniella sp.]|uniref:fatty acid--CoA ligase n=1 Tax=uncultured Castellaniella sp. TaxID=647907 RepID=UPI00262BED69|nr:fatty acid--CoA ligase [uncultured Castellaniella sp.]
MTADFPMAASSAYGYPLLIRQLFESARANASPNEIVHQGRRLRYAEFFDRVVRLARALADLGVRRGDVVAVMDWDSHRYLEAFFAVPMMGAVLQTVNVRLSPEQIAYTLNDAEAGVLLIHDDFIPILDAIQGRLRTVRHRLSLTDQPDGGRPGAAAEYEALLSRTEPDFEFPELDEQARATTFYTTGTTGQPKGVYFSHRQLVLHTLSTAAALGGPLTQGRLHREDVYMPMTPMFHVHAWGFPYVATLLGLRQIYPGRYQPDVLLRLIRDERVTFSHSVPTILHMLLGHADAADTDFSALKMIIGGSAMPQGLARTALDRGIDVFTGYGMSETCPILTLAQMRDPAADAGARLRDRTRTGYAIPLVMLRVVDDEMRDVAHDGRSVGEVVVRAPWLTQGYLRNPDASEALWRGGWLHTGDIGTLDARGMLTVTDRLKDVIKTGGEWVSSLALEDAVSRHPAVSEVAVVGMPDARWGERPLVLVVLRPGQDADAAQIRAQVQAEVDAGRLSRYAVPEQVRFVDSLPRTSVGKLNKRAMRESLSAEN